MEQHNIQNVMTDKKGERLTRYWRNGGETASIEHLCKVEQQ